ncbi:pyridoxamine kinase [Kockiozyma suomiensis]|uniref:pyridoxamine kinase n=1 Tax=Kockiozyma suomiensis TaxID=1337062 RepID=UPI00334346B1
MLWASCKPTPIQSLNTALPLRLIFVFCSKVSYFSPTYRITMVHSLPRVLTIAGSDSSGGAGIEADLKTITVHGCYGMTCITGLTAQNTTGVKEIFSVPHAFVEVALDADLTDIGVDAVKTGMLTSADTIRSVAKKMKEYNVSNICVDPVMISTSGSHLLPDAAVSGYLTDLFPIATIITPNLQEAQFIYNIATGSEMPINSLEEAKSLAKGLYNLGPKYVLLKGGHLPLSRTTYKRVPFESANSQTIVADIIYDGTSYEIIESPFIITKNTHGTGCTLSSAIASNLAKQMSVSDAVKEAIDYVHCAIADDLQLGKGNGPINHLHKS